MVLEKSICYGFGYRSASLLRLNVLQCEANLKITALNVLQILKDETTREKYDYAIAHPEEVFRFSYR